MSETALDVTARWSELLTLRRRRSCFDYQFQTTAEARRRNPQARSHELMDIRVNEPEVRALMLRGLEGDAVAHKALLKGLGAYLRAYFKGQLVRIGRGPADAEDLVQETLIALHIHRHTYDRSQLLTPWVYAIARYKLVDYLRRAKASVTDVPIEEEAHELLADDGSSAVESGLDLK